MGMAAETLGALDGQQEAAPSRPEIVVRPIRPGHSASALDTLDGYSPEPAERAAKRTVNSVARIKFDKDASSVDSSASFFRHLGHGATANFSDELRGAAAAGGFPPKTDAEIGSAPAVLLGLGRMGYEATAPYLGIHSGTSATDAYTEEKNRRNELLKIDAEQNPGASLTGDLVGGVATPLPFGKAKTAEAVAEAAARGAGRLGEALAAFKARSIHGAKVGATYGALAGAGEGEGATGRAVGAGVGAGVGGAVGLLAPGAIEAAKAPFKIGGHLLGNPVRTARGWMDVEGEANRRVGNSAIADFNNGGIALTPQEQRAAALNGQGVVNSDLLGDNSRSLLRVSGNVSPEARGLTESIANARFRTQNERASNFVQNLYGGDLSTTRLQDTVERVAAATNGEAYKAAHQAAAMRHPGGMWDEGFKQFLQHPDVQDAATKVLRGVKGNFAKEGIAPLKEPPIKFVDGEARLTNPEMKPSSQFWEQVYKYSRDTVSELYRKGRTAEAGDLKEVVGALKNHLDSLAPELKDARAGAAKFFDADNMLEAGKKFIGSNSDVYEAQKLLNSSKVTRQERELFAYGFSDELARKFRSLGPSVDVVNRAFVESPESKRKIVAALGTDKAAQLETFLKTEAVMDKLRRTLGGSDTTRKLVELGAAGGVAGGAGYAMDDFKTPSAIFSSLLIRPGMKYFDQTVARRVAEKLTSSDPEQVMQGVRAVARNFKLMSSMRNITDGLVEKVAASRGAPIMGAAASVEPSRADEDKPQ